MRLFHDQFSAQHAHLALKAVLTRFFGGEFKRDPFALWQHGNLVEIGEQYFRIDHLKI